MPGFSTASWLGTRASTVKERDSVAMAGLTAVMVPANRRPGYASTVAVTVCPFPTWPACTAGMVS